ncbi:MAG: cbb3-type cytochrome c oxidase subunit I, partial [Thiohalorhabdus sp.]
MAQAQSATAGQAATHEAYNYHVIRQFTVMTLVWGIVGMLAGVFIALELAYPELMYALTGSSEYLNFSRLRPVHTSGVIFAFGGS